MERRGSEILPDDLARARHALRQQQAKQQQQQATNDDYDHHNPPMSPSYGSPAGSARRDARGSSSTRSTYRELPRGTASSGRSSTRRAPGRVVTKGKVEPMRVVVRARPTSLEEEGYRGALGFHGAKMVRVDSGPREQIVGGGQWEQITDFEFDQVYPQNSPQDVVFRNEVLPLIDDCLLGYSCSVWAYGQTGTGKTHTLEGREGSLRNKYGSLDVSAGMIPQAVHALFRRLFSLGKEYCVYVSFLEIFNEELKDLLSVEDEPLKILPDEHHWGVLVQGLTERLVTTASDIFEYLAMGSEKRKTAETSINKNSSRSHCVFSMTIQTKTANSKKPGENIITTGKLNFMDLAGSESVNMQTNEERAKEAVSINKSLLSLGRVISSLMNKSKHHPYRDSSLTRFMKECLGGREKAVMIATISPSQLYAEETLQTLEMACRAMQVKNRPKPNRKMKQSDWMAQILPILNARGADSEKFRAVNREKNDYRRILEKVLDERNELLKRQAAKEAEAEEFARDLSLQLSDLNERTDQFCEGQGVALKKLEDAIRDFKMRKTEELDRLVSEAEAVLDGMQDTHDKASRAVQEAQAGGAAGARPDASGIEGRVEAHGAELVAQLEQAKDGIMGRVRQVKTYLEKELESAHSAAREGLEAAAEDARVFVEKRVEDLKGMQQALRQSSDEQVSELEQTRSELSKLARQQEERNRREMDRLLSGITDMVAQFTANQATQNKAEMDGLRQQLDGSISSARRRARDLEGLAAQATTESTRWVEGARAGAERRAEQVRRAAEDGTADNAENLRKELEGLASEATNALESAQRAQQQHVESIRDRVAREKEAMASFQDTHGLLLKELERSRDEFTSSHIDGVARFDEDSSEQQDLWCRSLGKRRQNHTEHKGEHRDDVQVVMENIDAFVDDLAAPGTVVRADGSKVKFKVPAKAQETVADLLHRQQKAEKAKRVSDAGSSNPKQRRPRANSKREERHPSDEYYDDA